MLKEYTTNLSKTKRFKKLISINSRKNVVMLCLKLKKCLTNTQKGIRINDLLILKTNIKNVKPTFAKLTGCRDLIA